LTPQTLYAQLGLLDDVADPSADVERSIRKDPRLGTKQKDALLLMYRTFMQQADE
jgi:hypothetical protein